MTSDAENVQFSFTHTHTHAHPSQSILFAATKLKPSNLKPQGRRSTAVYMPKDI